MSASFFRVQEHIIPTQHIREYPGATAYNQEDVLKLHIKQYTPLSPTAPPANAVTIIGAHANGFPKELYEPLWDEIYKRSAGRFSIRSIWIADVAHQGQSYALNEAVIGNDPSWFDHPRDLLHMVNCFRREMPRPIVGIGHSMGGAHLINLALMHPRLLTALTLLDPVVSPGSAFPPQQSGKPRNFGVATASTHRRDLWSSRDEAVTSFRKSEFYQSWDKRVLDLWLKYGLRELPTAIYPDVPPDVKGADKPVTLATPKHQEVWTFIRPNFKGQDSEGKPVFDRKTVPDLGPELPLSYPFYRPEGYITYQRLPNLRPPTFYIMGEFSNLEDPRDQRNKVKVTGIGLGGSGGLAEGRVKDIILPRVGHLVAMEATNTTAQETVEWLSGILKDWRADEERWNRERKQVPRRDLLVVSEEWMKHIGELPRRGGAASNSKPDTKL